MAIELVTCKTCGTKNASGRAVCLRCGAALLTRKGDQINLEGPLNKLDPASQQAIIIQHLRDLVRPQIIQRLRDLVRPQIKQQLTRKLGLAIESLPTGEYKAAEAAKAVLSGAPALFKAIQKRLGNRKIQTEWFVEFAMELTCYVLHLLDRTLSDLDRTVSVPVRDKVMTDLKTAICNEHHSILKEIGYEITIDDVWEAFSYMYNERQPDYGSFKEDWFVQTTLRFGQHAAEALEATQGERAVLALHCALLAPAVFMDLMASLPIGVDG